MAVKPKNKAKKMNVGGVASKTKRNYVKENTNYKARPEQIAKRVKRNAARRAMERKGLVRKGDNRDVDHKNGNAMDNRPSNLRVVASKRNRSFPRTANATKKRKV